MHIKGSFKNNTVKLKFDMGNLSTWSKSQQSSQRVKKHPEATNGRKDHAPKGSFSWSLNKKCISLSMLNIDREWIWVFVVDTAS